MARPDREHERLGGNYAGADLRRQRLARDTDQRGVGVATGQPFYERLVVVLREDYLDPGVRTMEITEQPEDTVVHRAPGDPDPEGATQEPVEGGDRLSAVFDFGDCGARMR